MSQRVFIISIALFFLIVTTQSTKAEVIIAHWNFDDGDLLVESGAGTASVGGLLTQDHISPDWLNSRWSTASSPEDGRHVEFQVSTTGLSSIQFEFHGKRNNATFGPTSWAVYYSTDGVNFVDASCGGSLTTTNTLHSCTWAWDSPIGATIGNQPNLYFRLYGFNAGSTGLASKFHIDNVTIRALTDPTAVSLQNTQATTTPYMGMGLLILFSLGATAYWVHKQQSS